MDIPLHREPNDGMLTVDVLRKCHCMLVIVNILVNPARNNFPGGSACCASKTNWHLATRIAVTKSAALLGDAETCRTVYSKGLFSVIDIFFCFASFSLSHCY